MKKLFDISVILLLCTFGFTASHLLFSDSKYFERHFTSNSGIKAPLYVSANKKSRLKYSLANNETVLFRYYSFSKKWSYVSYKGQLLVALTDNISLDHVRYKDWTVDKLHLETVLYVCSILFLILMYRQANNGPKVQHLRNVITRLNEQKIRADEKLADLVITKGQLEGELHSYCQGFRVKADRSKIQIEQLTKKQRALELALAEVHSNFDCEKSKVESLETEVSTKDRLIRKFEENKATYLKQKQIQLEEFYKIESERAHTPTIHAMQESKNLLEAQLDKQIIEGRVFGIDFKHERYENILKGRKFEIYIAKRLKEQNYSIEEWSPDKGFEQNILVESNLKPDLIVRSRDGVRIAIECKYRGKLRNLLNINTGKIIEYSTDWASLAQRKRYKNFSKEAQIPVYVALGVSGPADDPDDFFVFDMARTISIGFVTAWPKKGGGDTKHTCLDIKTINALDIKDKLDLTYTNRMQSNIINVR
jgi:hypothetical protein